MNENNSNIENAPVENGEKLSETNKPKSNIKKELRISFGNRPIIIMLFVLIASFLVAITALISPDFAEYYSRTVGRFLRMILAKITGVFPFSLAETLLVAAIALLIYSVARMLYEAFKRIDYEKRYEPRFNRVAVFCLMLALSLYNLAFSPCNRRYTAEKNFGLERGELTPQQLYDCLVIVQDELYEILEHADIRALPSGSSVMPYSFGECNKILNGIYKEASNKYPFVDGFSSRVKAVALSELMTHTHIAGIYTPYTGEVNINTNYPDYVKVFSMGHEMAHQRGIAREDEANFVAFVVMYESDDDYMRYSALIELFSYLSDALYNADYGLFERAVMLCDDRILYEMIGFTDFFRPYQSSVAANVSNAINDTSIKLRGDENGAQSYDMMIELAAAYFGVR